MSMDSWNDCNKHYCCLCCTHTNCLHVISARDVFFCFYEKTRYFETKKTTNRLNKFYSILFSLYNSFSKKISELLLFANFSTAFFLFYEHPHLVVRRLTKSRWISSGMTGVQMDIIRGNFSCFILNNSIHTKTNTINKGSGSHHRCCFISLCLHSCHQSRQ